MWLLFLSEFYPGCGRKFLEFHFLPPAIWPCWWVNLQIQWAITFVLCVFSRISSYQSWCCHRRALLCNFSNDQTWLVFSSNEVLTQFFRSCNSHCDSVDFWQPLRLDRDGRFDPDCLIDIPKCKKCSFLDLEVGVVSGNSEPSWGSPGHTLGRAWQKQCVASLGSEGFPGGNKFLSFSTGMDWSYISGVIWVVTANKGFCRLTDKENACDLKGSSSKNAHEVHTVRSSRRRRFSALPIITRQWLSKIHKNLGHPSINKYHFVCNNRNLLIKLLRVPETSNASPVSSKKLQEAPERRPCRSPGNSMTVLDAFNKINLPQWKSVQIVPRHLSLVWHNSRMLVQIGRSMQTTAFGQRIIPIFWWIHQTCPEERQLCNNCGRPHCLSSWKTGKVGLLLQAVLDIEILDIKIVTASRFLTVPQKLSRADKSGLVFVAARCKDPNYSSQALMFPCGYFHLFMFSARPLHMNGIDGEEIILTHVKIVVFNWSDVFSREREVLLSFAPIDSKYVQTFLPHNIAHHKNSFQ